MDQDQSCHSNYQSGALSLIALVEIIEIQCSDCFNLTFYADMTLKQNSWRQQHLNLRLYLEPRVLHSDSNC